MFIDIEEQPVCDKVWNLKTTGLKEAEAGQQGGGFHSAASARNLYSKRWWAHQTEQGHVAQS